MERDASKFLKHAFAFAVVLIASILAQPPKPQRAPGSTDADEQAMRPGRWIRTIQSDLINEKFDELDQMATEYRQSKS